MTLAWKKCFFLSEYSHSASRPFAEIHFIFLNPFHSRFLQSADLFSSTINVGRQTTCDFISFNFLQMNTASAVVWVLLILVTRSVPLLEESVVVEDSARFLPGDETEPCDAGDYRCYNERGLQYVNALRSIGDIEVVKMGTEAMLEYAIEHAKDMAATRRVYNLTLPKLSVGCGSALTGDNVASVHLSEKGELADGVAICTTHWNNGTDHSKNILAPFNTEVVTGAARDEYGYIYCSQLFARNTKFTKRGPCSRASVIYQTPEPSAEYTEPTEEPFQFIGSEGHVFRHRFVKVSFTDGSSNDMELECSDDKGCRYCTLDGAVCLPEERSIGVDIKAEAAPRKE